MTRDDAYNIVKQYVNNQNLRNHMLAVEAAMKFYALQYEPEHVEKWQIVGLLHDFDWEIHPTMEDHPQKGAEILKQLNVPEDIIRAVLSHADYTGTSRVSIMEKALFACDEITGLITAVVMVRPSKSLMDLSVSSVKKKWKNLNFAAGANRKEIQEGAEEFGIDLWQHVENVITAMQSIASEIGLAGAESMIQSGE
ncbi:MAG: HDIG domain-containing protein [Anaerolineaceae bacterium]|nr:HDIG domain-containing protein [Anaerolineaceae bacterium]